MIVTLSERRLSEVIRSVEGIGDSDSEIAFRMPYFAGRLFSHVAEYGVRMTGLLEHQGDIGSFQFDIGSVGRSWQTGDFDWQKLRDGLNFINPVCVTVEERDIEAIFVGLFATSMLDNFELYERELQRISVNEIQSKLEALSFKYCLGPGIETTAMTPNEKVIRELEMDGQFARANMVDPALQSRTIAEFREREAAEYQAAEQKRKDDFYKQNYNR